MGLSLAFSSNPVPRSLPLFSPAPASRVFYGFLPQSLRVISWKFMAAGLTRSICSPKLGSVEKSIRKVCLLTGGWIRSTQTKQKTPTPTNQTKSLPGPRPEPRRGLGCGFEVGSALTSPGGFAVRYALGVLNGDQISLFPGRASRMP